MDFLDEIVSFSNISPLFPKQITNMHKITSLEDDMRKFLDQKILSHGTSLGYLGSKSQADVGLGACRLQFLVIWGPSELPVPMKFHANAKNLKTVGSWCGIQQQQGNRVGIASRNFLVHCLLLLSSKIILICRDPTRRLWVV